MVLTWAYVIELGSFNCLLHVNVIMWSGGGGFWFFLYSEFSMFFRLYFRNYGGQVALVTSLSCLWLTIAHLLFYILPHDLLICQFSVPFIWTLPVWWWMYAQHFSFLVCSMIISGIILDITISVASLWSFLVKCQLGLLIQFYLNCNHHPHLKLTRPVAH
jgi:hypothetical protein